MWRDNRNIVDSFYPVRPDCDELPETKFRIKIGKTLSERKWRSAFDSKGRLDIASVLGRIQRAGVHPSIRGEVWEFLLGCFHPKSTYDEREKIRQQRRLQYARLKEECKQIDSHVGSGIIVTAPLITEDGQPIEDPLVLQPATDVGSRSKEITVSNKAQPNTNIPLDKNVIEWKLTLHQIGLDVLRTDRSLLFYEKKESESKLWDILAVYAWIDKEVGYSQGMSDICSPMIILFEDEADAFWCFEHLMRRLRGNFRCVERKVGVESQLQNLASITQVLDPKLHQHIEAIGGGDYLFAFRMFMVLFRRELSFGDSLFLWEMMWALEYDPDMYTVYEEHRDIVDKKDGSKGKHKSLRQFGKYERDNLRNGSKISEAALPMSVFLVASVLKQKSSKLMHEARGLDDIVMILNGTTGNLDAKKVCTEALKLHKKYLKMAKKT